MVYPSGTGVTPVDCMPENVKTVFLEAQSIGGISPRASAAMLRVALERLVNDVGGKGSNLAGKIASLHLSPRLQKLCDICRAAGNEAVHHESFDFSASNEEARAMVEALSEFINRLADEFCGLEKAADELQRKINAARTK